MIQLLKLHECHLVFASSLGAEQRMKLEAAVRNSELNTEIYKLLYK